MAKTSRVFSVIIVCCLAMSTLTAPALSQENQPTLRQDELNLAGLELRRDDLTALITDKETALGTLEDQIFELANTIAFNNTQIELLADDLEESFDERQEPAATQVETALISFKRGDPRASGLTDELSSFTNSSALARRRVLYESVITDATRRLNDIDNRIHELAQQIAETRRLVVESQSQFQQRQTSQQELTNEIATADAELRNTLADIQVTSSRIEKARSSKALLTGLTIAEQVSRPALVVKIDNVGRAWPQSGMNQADIVFVEEVEFATRLAAVFHSTAPSKVGPVRSMRTSDFDLLAQLNSPLFANSGGNRGTIAALSRSTLVNIGAGTAANLYYRSSNRSAPHNLYTNTENLWSVGSRNPNAGLPSPMFVFREPGEPVNSTAVPARSIDISYQSTRVQYTWNGSGWDRTQNGRPMIDTSGVRTSPATVIVQFTNYGRSAADSRSPEAITVGSGPALVFTDGHAVEATWSRERATDVTVYSDSQGRRISILPGRTWVELPRPGTASYS